MFHSEHACSKKSHVNSMFNMVAKSHVNSMFNMVASLACVFRTRTCMFKFSHVQIFCMFQVFLHVPKFFACSNFLHVHFCNIFSENSCVDMRFPHVNMRLSHVNMRLSHVNMRCFPNMHVGEKCHVNMQHLLPMDTVYVDTCGLPLRRKQSTQCT
jgi:hypothetical protein